MNLFEDRDRTDLPSAFIGGDYHWQVQMNAIQGEIQKLRRLRQQWSSERPTHLNHPRLNSKR